MFSNIQNKDIDLIYRLIDTVVRYKLHKDFFSQRMAEELVPNGLKLELGQTIGNYDLETWYESLIHFV